VVWCGAMVNVTGETDLDVEGEWGEGEVCRSTREE
jgi:hypothetical protein